MLGRISFKRIKWVRAGPPAYWIMSLTCRLARNINAVCISYKCAPAFDLFLFLNGALTWISNWIDGLSNDVTSLCFVFFNFLYTLLDCLYQKSALTPAASPNLSAPICACKPKVYTLDSGPFRWFHCFHKQVTDHFLGRLLCCFHCVCHSQFFFMTHISFVLLQTRRNWASLFEPWAQNVLALYITISKKVIAVVNFIWKNCSIVLNITGTNT